MLAVTAVLAGLPHHHLRAQASSPPAASAHGTRGSVSGQVVRVTPQGDRPVARQWVIVHGIGEGGGRALDSVRTTANGSFRFAYPRADSTAQYFISTVHHGIAYVSGVLPPDAGVDEATLSVFDTTSAPVPLVVRGRHILLFAPDDNPRRRVAEIYDISNDSTVTRIARDGQPPIWSATVPARIEEFSSGPEVMSNESIRLEEGRVAAYAPVAPGLKRIAFTYALPPDAFPARFAIDHPTDVFEILVEDRDAVVAGPGLEETAPSNIEGRLFRRFQAQSIAPPSVVTVTVPRASAAPRGTNVALVVLVGAIAVGALAFALRRSRSRVVSSPAPVAQALESDTEALAREIAALDAAFERSPAPTASERATYERERERLKRQLADRLAARSGR